MRRGQGAIEFVFITTAMLLFFTVAFIIAERNYVEIQEQRFEQTVYGLMDRVQSEFSAAFQAGDGYEREFYLPATIVGNPYDIRLALNQTPRGKDELVVDVLGEEYFRFLQIPVNGTIGQGRHRIQGGDPVQITTLS